MTNVVYQFDSSEIVPDIAQFKTRPLYGVQVNKNNCRVVISCNDIPHWLTFYKNYGESMFAYLNNYIPKSGRQLITVQIFPKEGNEFIAQGAAVDIKILRAPDKDSPPKDYKTLLDTSLSDLLGDQKLAYYEMKVPFDATVPFDFSKELDEARDLKTIPNIEKLVYDKYNQLREYLIKGDALPYLQERKRSQTNFASYLYPTKEELLSDHGVDNIDENMLNVKAIGRGIPTLDNCEMIFAYGGKLALLKEKKTKKDAIRVIFNKGKENEREIETNVILYMPVGSNELKIW